jgi:hypothetical protein
MMGLSNYPPGFNPAPQDTCIQMLCVNRNCPEVGVLVDIAAYFELGGTFLRDESQGYCPECGWERGNDSDRLHVVAADHATAYVQDGTWDLLALIPSALTALLNDHVHKAFRELALWDRKAASEHVRPLLPNLLMQAMAEKLKERKP